MKIITREQLDLDRWNQLVARSKHRSFFSFSWYLDAVAENWCVIVDEAYSAGMALPYTQRMGVQILYIPIFSRFVSPLGVLTQEAAQVILEHFSVGEVGTSAAVFSASTENATRVFQCVDDWESRTLSSQAKRSLKKAEKCGVQVQIHQDFTNVFNAIQLEIAGKFKGVDDASMKALERLFHAAKGEECLRVFEVDLEGDFGGVVCLEDATQLLYVKGACSDTLKKNGGMYLALNSAANYAKEKGLRFDFGGSNVEGVRRFNQNLGGVDVSYHFYQWNNAPFWFNFARKLKGRLG